jgi:Tfp pilus assembly protein PilF
MKRGIPKFVRPVTSERRFSANSGPAASTAAWHDLYNRGSRFSQENRLLEALAAFERATALAPHAMEPRRELASTLYKLGRTTDALREFNEVAERFADRSDAANNVAGVLVELGRFELAFEAVQRALVLDPHNLVAMHNLAEILKHLGSWEAARDVYAAALAMAPDHAKARMQYGMTLAALGDWTAGWQAMEARLTAIGATVLFPETPDTPTWDGVTTIDGHHVLIQHEQGLGDSIMMVRFARELAARGALVHVRCPAPLVDLLRSVEGVVSCTAVGDPFPPHHLHVPLMSLPALLGVTKESVSGAAYLTPIGECPPHIAAMLPRDGMLTVALTWSGNPLHINDHRRSIRGELLAPLLRIPDVRFVAMQKAPSVSELLPAALQPLLTDLGAHCNSFVESAHALQRVDLFVTVDTAVAHLAGAIGAPTLLCLPFCPDFRWGVSHSRSAWYDSMTILRQPDASGWNHVLADIGAHVVRLRDTTPEVH